MAVWNGSLVRPVWQAVSGWPDGARSARGIVQFLSWPDTDVHYRVQVLVRSKSNVEEEFPPAVQIIEGDLCDPRACKEAVSGVDKVGMCDCD